MVVQSQGPLGPQRPYHRHQCLRTVRGQHDTSLASSTVRCWGSREDPRVNTDVHGIKRFPIVSFRKFQGTLELAKLDESYGSVGSRVPAKHVLNVNFVVAAYKKPTGLFSSETCLPVLARQRRENRMESSMREQPARQPYNRRCLHYQA